MQKKEDSLDIPVVCADVDGTIIATDLLYESLLVAIKKNPAIVFLVPFWLIKGRAHLKAKLAERAQDLAFDRLPIREEVAAYLKEQSLQGRTVVLASASHHLLVRGVAQQLGFVESIVASDAEHNCKGASKAAAIEKHVGGKGWEYVGDSSADRAVWRRAKRAVCVSRSHSFTQQIKREFPDSTIFQVKPCTWRTYVRALRMYQWLKNLLVFAPVVLAHQWFHPGPLFASLLAAISFSLCASGVYLLNDLLDLDSDRQHPRKRARPCASGELPIQFALAMSPVLFLSAFACASLVSGQFSLVLALYLVLTTAYSFRLKALALVDIILLAMLYTIRIVGGGVAANVTLSQWLLGLSMFLFLSLACVKRFSELLVLQQRNEKKTWGRGYWVGDLEQVGAFGAASGYISVLVLALYVSSNEVVHLYGYPRLIWLACPLLLYWISRIWLLARRGLVHDDPIVFALRDKVTYIVAVLGVAIFLAAKLFHDS
jgi:4-hydroxybenzoate polyprenyltransferase/phosphoserine phosphatase